MSILKSLLKDGRKSFEISRETGITTPTVKARFTRLVNVGLIKSVSPIIDFNIIEEENILSPEYEQHHDKGNKNSKVIKNEDHKSINKRHLRQQQDIRSKIRKGLKIKLYCEFCKGPISANPYVFKFANFERFFCCTGCMAGYKQKYAGRIEPIKRKFEGKE